MPTLHSFPCLLLLLVPGVLCKYRVLTVTPRTSDQLLYLRSIAETKSRDVADFWHLPSTVNESIHVMAGPNSDLEVMLRRVGVEYDMAMDDLERDLEEKASLMSKRLHLSKRLHDESPAPFGSLPLAAYHSYSSISDSLQRVAASSRGLARVVQIGMTVEGRRITGIKIGDDDGRKPVVVFDGGIHAREWATVHTALYIINQLLSRSVDSRVKQYLEQLVIYVFPVLNPDGYEYTRFNETNPQFRLWRKNRGHELCSPGLNGEKNCCLGVDLNRNFDFQFGSIGSSRYICSEIFNGPYPFSEPETKAIRDFFLLVKGRVKAYITLHSYSQLFIHSYSHKNRTYPKDIDDIRRVAGNAVREMAVLYGTKYQVGTGPEIIYGYSGGSTDWTTDKIGVKYSYTIELRPLYSNPNGFVMHPSELIPTARETWRGLQVVMDAVLKESTCSDSSPSCSRWLNDIPQICETNQLSMRRDCAKSCGLC